MLRKIECRHYSRCLMDAAKKNREEFDCTGCSRFVEGPSMEDETMENITQKEDVMELIVETKKVCTNCGEEKELSEFHKAKASKLGVKNICKLCCADYAKNYKKNKAEGKVKSRSKGKPVVKVGKEGRNADVPTDTIRQDDEHILLQKAVALLVFMGHLTTEKLEKAMEFCRV